MSDFEPSSRSSKRRKVTTYGSDRSTAKSPSSVSPSVLRSQSNAVSCISRRLFEPQTKRFSAVPAVKSSLEATEQDVVGNQSSQNANDVEEGQEHRGTLHAVGGTEQPATDVVEASGKEDLLIPVRRSKRANGSAKDSMEDDASLGKSSARNLGGADGTMSPSGKRSLNEIGQISNGKRHSMKQPLANEGITKRRVTRSGGGDSTAWSKQGKRSKTDPASPTATHEPAPENEIEQNEDTITASQRSSGREKRKPRRYYRDFEDSAEQIRKKSVGILTPSKRNKDGSKKSVAFEDGRGQIEGQLDIKDTSERTQATEKIKRISKAIGFPTMERAEPELVDIRPEDLSAGEGDNPVEALATEDSAFPDLLPLRNTLSNAASAWKSLPQADEDPSLTAIKSKVLLRLTNSSLVPLTNLATEYAKVHSLLKATITAGEGNSLLILGARGSGKTNLVETALSDVNREHGHDFHIVRLSGFQQTDDKIALREIWRQLGKEMHVEEDETNQPSSYADTMASLLHLLSHPEELAEVLEPDAPVITTKSVIFVLNEFDLFATHPRQTLLYNLFDIAQAKKAPIAVVGCSTRVDVAESLEKRVKSRFSHRWVHLSQPKSFEAFEGIIRAALCIETDRDETVEDPDTSIQCAWNEYMKSTFVSSAPVQALLRQTFYTTKSVAAMFSSLYIPVASITSLDHTLHWPTASAPLTPPESPLQLLPSLPPLHLYLLVSAARLEAIHNASIINFNLVYHHYVELASRSRLQSSASGAVAQGGVTKIWGKEIAKRAWEELGDWVFLVPAALGKGKSDDAPETKMWRVDVTLEEIAACVGDVKAGVSDILAKWCKEV